MHRGSANETNPASGITASKPASQQRGIGLRRILAPQEEARLVDDLCRLRKQIEKLVRPLIVDAPETVRLDHFDQVMTYFQRLDRLPKSLARKVGVLLNGYNDIKHTLVLSNLPWVTKLARAQRQSAISEEDLFQEGVCGLLKAIDRFEASRGLRLMTYATWYIREAMQQVRARQSHLVSLSAHDQTLLGRLEAQRVAFQHENDRPPNAGEMEQRLESKNRSLALLQTATRPPVSLERGREEGTLPIAVEDPTREFERLEEVETKVQQLLDALPSRERLVVTMRFGLDGGHPASLETLGGVLKVSKERIRQLQRQAIRRMQALAREQGCPDCLSA
jgi:RNA polymerase primary sigma factor